MGAPEGPGITDSIFAITASAVRLHFHLYRIANSIAARGPDEATKRRKMRSSNEEAIRQLAKWQATNPAPKIRAILSASGVVMYASGFLSTNSEDVSEVLLVVIDENGKFGLTVPWSALIPADSPIFEPLVDLPDEAKLEADFLISVTFELPFGTLELQEIAG